MPMFVLQCCVFVPVGAIGEYSAFTVLHIKFMYAVHLCIYYY